MYSTYGNYGTTYGTASSVAGSAVAAIAIFTIIWSIICIAIAVVTIIGMWKMFTKAGEEGWKAIIPVYNIYTLCKIVGVSPWWILIVFGGSILTLIPILGILVGLALCAAGIYFGILIAKSTANAFGKDTGFAVGLYFLGPIFYCILGFGKAKYEGAKPMNDIIFKNAK